AAEFMIILGVDFTGTLPMHIGSSLILRKCFMTMRFLFICLWIYGKSRRSHSTKTKLSKFVIGLLEKCWLLREGFTQQLTPTQIIVKEHSMFGAVRRLK